MPRLPSTPRCQAHEVPKAIDQATSEALATFASAKASRRDLLVASGLCAAAAAATLAFMPWASRPVGPIPGFLAAYQAALTIVYGITTWFFVAQYRHTRDVSLLVLGSGSLFTTLIVLVQFACFPNIIAPGLVFGQGAVTLTWLWCAWHLGPPLSTLVYALVIGRPSRLTRQDLVSRRAWTGCAAAALAVAVLTLVTTRYPAALPRVLDPGGGYWSLTTSGVGPALIALTVVAFAILCWTTRLRTRLQVSLAASLVLLLLDNVITDTGAARATVGWFFGRVEALAAAIVILGFYLRELDGLYRRAASAVAERDTALRDAGTVRENLEIALDASGMGDWELDLASDRARRTLRHDRIFGYRELQPDWSYRRFLDHVVPEDRDLVRAAFDTTRQDDKFALECRIKRVDDGAIRWIALWGKTFFDASGRPSAMAGCVMDATEKRLDEQRLREAERMEAVGQLTGGVAHDFNNLLTVIMGSLDMIKRRPEDTARVQRLAQTAFSAGQRGSELTEKLLSFSRRQVVNPKTVNLNRLLSDFRQLVQRTVGETIKVKLDLDAQLDPARVDVGQFQAAILNLAGNARDAMPNGGTLTVLTRNLTPANADPDATDAMPGDWLQIVISDTGVGMDEATAARAFDPFFTTKDVGRGTGLGLSQVYGFAHQAGGRCRLKTAPGEGCAVEIHLPRSEDEIPRHRDEVGPVPIRRALGQEVVLIVEDEDAVREMAAESLEGLGYHVLTAPDARLALDLLKTPSRIDMLFSDVVMPGGMNGAQLAMQARIIRPDLKVLLTSGYTMTAAAGSRELPPDIPLLKKPYLREELATKLEAVLKENAAKGIGFLPEERGARQRETTG